MKLYAVAIFFIFNILVSNSVQAQSPSFNLRVALSNLRIADLFYLVRIRNITEEMTSKKYGETHSVYRGKSCFNIGHAMGETKVYMEKIEFNFVIEEAKFSSIKSELQLLMRALKLKYEAAAEKNNCLPPSFKKTETTPDAQALSMKPHDIQDHLNRINANISLHDVEKPKQDKGPLNQE